MAFAEQIALTQGQNADNDHIPCAGEAHCPMHCDTNTFQGPADHPMSYFADPNQALHGPYGCSYADKATSKCFSQTICDMGHASLVIEELPPSQLMASQLAQAQRRLHLLLTPHYKICLYFGMHCSST